jgi:membrane protease YdiL (CAAX protease family)
LVFALGWPKLIVDAAYSQGWLSTGSSTWLMIMYILGLPLVAAAVVITVTRGRAGLREWLVHLFRWRVSWRWYLFALLSYPAVASLAYTVSDWIHGREWSIINLWSSGFENLRLSATSIGLGPENSLQILAASILVNVLVSIFEEAGWRAYAIPRLQQRYSSLISGLVMGVIWSVWHLPYFFTKGAVHNGLPFAWFLLTLTSISIVLVWMMNHTNQSALMAILFHTSFNLSAQFLPIHLAYQNGDHLTFWLTCLFSVIGTLSIIFMEGSQLGRKSRNLHSYEAEYQSG